MFDFNDYIQIDDVVYNVLHAINFKGFEIATLLEVDEVEEGE